MYALSGPSSSFACAEGTTTVSNGDIGFFNTHVARPVYRSHPVRGIFVYHL